MPSQPLAAGRPREWAVTAALQTRAGLVPTLERPEVPASHQIAVAAQQIDCVIPSTMPNITTAVGDNARQHPNATP
jgi:hypothetical protein